jgi:hypothetical protein
MENGARSTNTHFPMFAVESVGDSHSHYPKLPVYWYQATKLIYMSRRYSRWRQEGISCKLVGNTLVAVIEIWVVVEVTRGVVEMVSFNRGWHCPL